MKALKKVAVSLFILLLLPVVAYAQAQPTASQRYEAGKACYNRVKADPRLSKDRTEWRRCIYIFESIANSQSGTVASKASYSAARLSRELYFQKHNRTDLDNALANYNRVIAEYPKSNLADDSLYHIGLIRFHQTKEPARAKKAFQTVIKRYPNSDSAGPARKMLASMERKPEIDEKPSSVPEDRTPETAYSVEKTYSDVPASSKNPGVLIDMSHSQRGDDTVVKLSFDRPVSYRATFDTGKGRSKSSSLELMLRETYARIGLPQKLKINSSTIRQVRVKPRILGGTVVDFSLHGDTNYSIVQDRRSIDVVVSRANFSQPEVGRRSRSTYKKESFWKRMWPWKNKSRKDSKLRIVIDPGHGGEEDGAVGPHGVAEKSVVMSISKLLEERLRNDLGAKVWLTRKKDKTVSLKKRYKKARKKKADLFISVHANASQNPKHRGIETYYLNNATDEAAKKLAARENESWTGPKSDIDRVLATMLQNAITDESRELASDVQETLVANLKERYRDVRNRKARSALFYVLVGTECPSILVETSFITNPREEMRLADPTYQQLVASSIADGVKKFLERRPAQASL